jgi:hypothetical protein
MKDVIALIHEVGTQLTETGTLRLLSQPLCYLHIKGPENAFLNRRSKAEFCFRFSVENRVTVFTFYVFRKANYDEFLRKR